MFTTVAGTLSADHQAPVLRLGGRRRSAQAPGHPTSTASLPTAVRAWGRRKAQRAAAPRSARGCNAVVAMSASQEIKVRFTNPSGESLVGILHEPSPVGSGDDADGAALPGCVVLCHGYMDSKSFHIFPRLARALQAQGMSALRFDFAGNGESEGTFDFCAYMKEVEDIRSAVEFLRSQGRTVHAVVGHSKGAAEALLYASKYDDVPRVVSISARYNMVRGISERFGEDIFDRLRRGGEIEMSTRSGFKWMLKHESVMERMNTDMGAAAESIKNTAVMTVHGAADEVIPVADAREFDKRIRDHVLHVVSGANHNYTDEEHAEALEMLVVDWIVSPKA